MPEDDFEILDNNLRKTNSKIGLMIYLKLSRLELKYTLPVKTVFLFVCFF